MRMRIQMRMQTQVEVEVVLQMQLEMEVALHLQVGMQSHTEPRAQVRRSDILGAMSESDPQALSLSPAKPWSLYLVRAANGALYCGISDDPQRRFAAHQSGKGARFFASSPAVALVYVEVWPSKGEALRQERLVKRLRKSAKEALVAAYVADPVGAIAAQPSVLLKAERVEAKQAKLKQAKPKQIRPKQVNAQHANAAAASSCPPP